MRIWRMALRCAAMVSCALVLSACATNPASQPDVSNGTDGLVYATSLNSKMWKDAVQIKSVSTQQIYDLRIDQRARIETMHAWIPAGDYVLASWDGAKYPAYEPIHVVSRQVTDLGTLIPVQVGEYKFVVLPLHEKDMAPAMATLRATYPGDLDNAAANLWSPSAMAPQLTQPGQGGGGLVMDLILAYARKLAAPPINQGLTASKSMRQFLAVAEAESPPTTQVGVADRAGDLYFGAALGEIRVRHPDGYWSAINTGVIHQVTAVGWNGHWLVAGYDDGSIRISEDRGAHWSRDATLPSRDPVLSLEWTGQRWLVETFDGLVTIPFENVGKDVAVYESKNASPSDFSEIYKKRSREYTQCNVQLVGHSYYVSTEHEVDRLDLNSMKWAVMKLPTFATAFYVAPDHRTMTVTHAAGIFSSVWMSRDGGAHWVKTSRPTIVDLDVKYLSPRSGVAVQFQLLANSSRLRLWRYSASAQDWKLDEPEPPSSCVWFVDDARGVPTYCVTRGWDILARHAGSWAIEATAASTTPQNGVGAKT